MNPQDLPAPRKGARGLAVILAALAAASLLFSCIAPARAPEKVAAEAEIPYQSMAASLATGNPDKALQDYEAAVKSRPQARETRLLHARLLILAGKLEEAREELDLLIGEDARDAGALYNLSVLEGLRGNRKAQKELLLRTVEADPVHADALAALGDLALEAKDPASAHEYFSRALGRDGNSIIALMGEGALQSAAREYGKAAELFTRAIQVQPDFPFAYVDRARARRAQGDTAGAIADLSAAVHLDPGYSWNYLDRGKLYLQSGNSPEALQDFTMAVQLDPGLVEGYALRAELLYRGFRDREALPDYEKLVSLRPDYYFAYEPLGVLYMLAGAYEKSARAFREALRFEEDEFSYALLAALALRRAGKARDALDLLQSVVPRIPRDFWQYEAARFLMDPATDYPLTSRADKERNRTARARMLYYLAAVYLAGDKTRAALSYLLEIENTSPAASPETRLAAGELARLTRGR
jgi:tetratricopeptide (TPR) repeat protein